MRWFAATEAMFLALLLWGSLFAFMYIHDRVLYFSLSTPAAQKAEALIREWLSPAQLHDYEKRKKFEVSRLHPRLGQRAAYLFRAGELARTSSRGCHAGAQDRIRE
jgi:hypothetical protein